LVLLRPAGAIAADANLISRYNARRHAQAAAEIDPQPSHLDTARHGSRTQSLLVLPVSFALRSDRRELVLAQAVVRKYSVGDPMCSKSQTLTVRALLFKRNVVVRKNSVGLRHAWNPDTYLASSSMRKRLALFFKHREQSEFAFCSLKNVDNCVAVKAPRFRYRTDHPLLPTSRITRHWHAIRCTRHRLGANTL